MPPPDSVARPDPVAPPPPTALDAELVATGAELLNGGSVNTHAQRLGGRLEEVGFRLRRETTVGDEEADIARAVREALARTRLVFVSGGLGPTCDDRTREAVAGMLGRRLRMDARALELLRRHGERTGRELTESRQRQALVVEGAAVLPNRAGAAPGQRIELDGQTLFLLPGPPPEFAAILDDEIVPWLRRRFPHARPPAQRLFQLCGLPEADAVERLAAAGFSPGPLELAYAASPGRLEIRLVGKPDEAALVAGKAEELRRILAPFIYTEGRKDLAAVVGQRLVESGATLAVAESCTGGGLGRRVTSIPGSSAWFRGGLIAYANDIKIGLLGVPPELLAHEGAVSGPVAEGMARGARERCGATWGLAITGIAGPGGGTPEKPVGLAFLACADAAGVRVERHRFPGDREQVREWAIAYALDLLRRQMSLPREEKPA